MDRDTALRKGEIYIKSHCPKYGDGDNRECLGPKCFAYDFCNMEGGIDQAKGREALDFFNGEGKLLQI